MSFHQPFKAAFVWAVAACALGGALGCDGTPTENSTATTSSTSTHSGGSGGHGGSGGAGGQEPLPTLDPAACPVTPDSGADSTIAEAAEAQWSPTYVAPPSTSIQQDKAFFLVTLLRGDDALLNNLMADPTLAAISADRDERIRSAAETCVGDVGCYRDALVWSEVDAAAAADAFHESLVSSALLTSTAKIMRESGRFSLHAPLDDDTLVKTALLDYLTALGEAFEDEAGALGGGALLDIAKGVADAHPSPFTFFEPLLEFDLAALIVDKRDEAARYEPLFEGENAAALAYIPTIDWVDFPFTVILVPGKGPNVDGVALDPAGQMRSDLAAQRFEAGIAPLIVLSGGHVHPDRTPYSEAIEMKHYLMDAHGISEKVLLVDPHARHTTTNLRNVSRLLYRYGVPTDKALLVTTDFGQSLYIGYWKGMFGPRCLDELGYLPWRSLVPISEFDTCMVPVAVSLHADGRDPLDP